MSTKYLLTGAIIIGGLFFLIACQSARLVLPPAGGLRSPTGGPELAARQVKLPGAVEAYTWSPDGHSIAIALREEKGVLVYDLNTATLSPLTDEIKTEITRLAFAPDQTILAIGDVGGTLYVWDLQTEAILSILNDPLVRSVRAIAFNSQGSLLAIGGDWGGTTSSDGVFKLYDTQTWSELAARETYGWLSGLKFHPQADLLAIWTSGACGRTGKMISLFDFQRGEMAPMVTPDETQINGDLDFSPDGRIVAAGIEHGARCIDDGGEIQLFDFETETLLGTISLHNQVSVAFSHDGRLLLTGDVVRQPDGSSLPLLRIRTAQTGLEVMRCCEGARLSQLSPDDTWLSYVLDNTLHLQPLPADLATHPHPSANNDPWRIVEDFNQLAPAQLQARYIIHPFTTRNQGHIRLVRRHGKTVLAVDYAIDAPWPDNLILVGRQDLGTQDWRGVRYLSVQVENDEHPKLFEVWLAEKTCLNQEPVNEACWRAWMRLEAGETRELNFRLDPVGSAFYPANPASSAYLPLNLTTTEVGYLALGLRTLDAESAPQQGTIYIEKMTLWVD